MTIPTLIQKYQEKAWNTSAEVFERKLETALSKMNTQQVLSGYTNTKEFVAALGAYFKITKVCDNNDILSCFPDKVFWGGEEVDMSEIKSAENFGQDDWGTETIGVQFANGTTGVIAYNPSCTEQPWSNQFKGTSCIAILYDTTGYKQPNTSSKDLRANGDVLSLGGSNCYFKIGNTCYGKPFHPDPLTKAECEAQKGDLGINKCYSKTDYWAGAALTCGGVTKMPSASQLVEIAEEVYGTSIASSGSTDADWNKTKAESMGFNTSTDLFGVFTNDEPEGDTGNDYTTWDNVAFAHVFQPHRTYKSTTFRSESTLYAICIMN